MRIHKAYFSFTGKGNNVLNIKGVPIFHFCRYADTPILVIADMPILPIFSGFRFTEKGVDLDSDSNPDPSFLVPITPLLFSPFPQVHVLQMYETCALYRKSQQSMLYQHLGK